QHGVGRLRVEAVGRKVIDGNVVVASGVAARHARVHAARTERAALERHPAPDRSFAAARHDVDDAAGVGAIQKALRTAQDLHSLQVVRGEQAVEVGAYLRAARVDGLDPVDEELGPVALLAANAQDRRLAGAAGVRDTDAGLRAQQV